MTLGEENGEAADESISRASGIARLDGERRDEFGAAAGRKKRTALRERENYAAKAFLQQSRGAGFGFAEGLYGQAGECFSFRLVGDEIVGVAELRKVHLLRGSRIHEAANIVGFGEPDGVIDRFERNFELQNDG